MIVVVGHDHFDPTWRRCFERPATYRQLCGEDRIRLPQAVEAAETAFSAESTTKEKDQ